MIAFDPELPCSCGGILQSMNWTQHLIFNIFFTLLGLGAIAFEKTDKPLNNKSGLSNS
jgi:hypothetical protein